MTPAHAIAKLQRQLVAHGQNVDLRKIASGQTQSEALAQRAFVRGYKPEELVGQIQQGDRNVVLLPDAAAIALKKGDKVVIAGAAANVEVAEIVRMDDVPVRVNVRVRG
ncbi:hypothetical protein [Brucella rhizosphaerae]|uniref:Uncharacterized protein n=1 Tax=Brucella rhizosphaerae TaxID=571254 RepID=A0A256FQK2_9HYPH|nr:hypothetical protein [Brucella rhizosphaerae]OYR16721.1 hypothetical protein CEV32_4355 [Brucella rhizosphaerae]